MTREEAINRIKDHMAVHHIGEYPHIKLKEALDMALSAFRPVSREKVEKVWRGEWKIITTHNGCTPDQDCVCSRCGASGVPDKAFCDVCGAPMTDEAVQMVMERLEAMKDGKGD